GTRSRRRSRMRRSPVGSRSALSSWTGACSRSRCSTRCSHPSDSAGSCRRPARSRFRPATRILRMAGHSKWATTKHKKAVIDARRAKSFAKLIKNIEVAAKMGGPDLAGNPTLYDAVQKAKKTSVPNDNIDRAIKRGAGISGESIEYFNIMYEAYGPAGVALMVECLTDNKNR